MPMTIEEAYALLEVHPSADEVTIKSAYKKMALRTHPDKNPNDPDARHKFQRVSEAYKRITDPDSFKEEDEEGDFEMDMDELNQMFFSLFEDMIPMAMGGFNSRGMGAGPQSMFDMLSGAFLDLDGDSEMDSDDGEMDDEDLEEVMAMMMMGGMGGPMGGMFEMPRHGGHGRGGRRGGSAHQRERDEMMFLNEMLAGMGGSVQWMDDGVSSTRKKNRKKKKSKPPASAITKPQVDEEGKWETDESNSDAGSPEKSRVVASAPPEVVSSSKKKRNRKKKSKKGSKIADMDDDVAELDLDIGAVPDMEQILLSMMMGSSSGAAVEDIFGGGSSRPRASNRAPATTKKASQSAKASQTASVSAPLDSGTNGKKRTQSKLSSDDDDEYNDASLLYEPDDLVLVNDRHLARVRYVGPVDYADGIFIGVELVEKSGVGKNNGTVKGVKYFSCPPNKGLMLRVDDIKPAPHAGFY